MKALIPLKLLIFYFSYHCSPLFRQLRNNGPFFLKWGYLERKNNPQRPLLHSKLGCLLVLFGSSNSSAQHSMEGVGEGKLNFPLLKSAKRQKGPLEQSVSTYSVAD